MAMVPDLKGRWLMKVWSKDDFVVVGRRVGVVNKNNVYAYEVWCDGKRFDDVRHETKAKAKAWINEFLKRGVAA